METKFPIPPFPSAEELPARLEQTLSALFDDFAALHTRYQDALNILRMELGASASPSVADAEGAIHAQMAYTLQFSEALGFQANWDHFMHPNEPTFLEEDFEDFLQESTLRTQRQYAKAQGVLSRFYRQLSSEQQEVYETILEYISYLETVCPKLAHFRGYLQGDALLKQMLPSYQPDTELVAQYRAMLEDYLEIKLPVQA